MKEIVAEVSCYFEFIGNDNLLGEWIPKINQTSMNMHVAIDCLNGIYYEHILICNRRLVLQDSRF